VSTSSSSSSEDNSEVSLSSEDSIAPVARDILARLPPLFDVPAAQAKCVLSIGFRVFSHFREFRFPVLYEDSMNTVLIQELVRFNALVGTIVRTLKNLLLAMEGTVLMSSDLDDVATSLRLRCISCFACGHSFQHSHCLSQHYTSRLDRPFIPQRKTACSLHH
jgi:dynein heavy chain